MQYKKYGFWALIIVTILAIMLYDGHKKRQIMTEQKDWYGWSVATMMASYSNIPYEDEARGWLSTDIKLLYIPSRPDRQSYFATNDGKKLVTMDYADNCVVVH